VLLGHASRCQKLVVCRLGRSVLSVEVVLDHLAVGQPLVQLLGDLRKGLGFRVAITSQILTVILEIGVLGIDVGNRFLLLSVVRFLERATRVQGLVLFAWNAM
jgi:hypothetical protein